jgi:hypothetical protein
MKFGFAFRQKKHRRQVHPGNGFIDIIRAQGLRTDAVCLIGCRKVPTLRQGVTRPMSQQIVNLEQIPNGVSMGATRL